MARHMVFSRPRFFSGQLLTAEDLAAEQHYHRAIQRFRNLHTHGYGIVSGLSVQTGDHGTSVTVGSGYAIDGFGREICIAAAVKLNLPADGNRLAVCAGYAETKTQPVAPIGNPLEAGGLIEHSRIEEGFQIVLRQIPPGKHHRAQLMAHARTPSNKWIVLAVLRRNGKRWRRTKMNPIT